MRTEKIFSSIAILTLAGAALTCFFLIYFIADAFWNVIFNVSAW